MNIESIVIHTDIKEKLQWLTDEEAGRLFKAIIAYAENGTVLSPDSDRVLGMIFLFIKDQIDRDFEKYQVRVKANRNNGSKGGRPPKRKDPKPNETDGLLEKPNETDGLIGNEEKTLPIPIPNPKDNPISIPKEDNGKAKRFTTPSLQEIEDYIKEKNLNVNAEQFFNYYESNGWMVGRNKMKNWKAALSQWSAREGTFGVQPHANTISKVIDSPQQLTSSERDWHERF